MTWTFPDVGFSRPRKQYMAVDLPAPFCPTRAKKSPSRISRLRPLSACTCLRKGRAENGREDLLRRSHCPRAKPFVERLHDLVIRFVFEIFAGQGFLDIF